MFITAKAIIATATSTRPTGTITTGTTTKVGTSRMPMVRIMPSTRTTRNIRRSITPVNAE